MCSSDLNQREVIYSLRLFALEGGEELKAEALRMIEAAVERLVDELIGDLKEPMQWDRPLMETEFLLKFLISVPGITDPTKIRSRDDLVRAAQRAAREAFQAKFDYLKEFEARLDTAALEREFGPSLLAGGLLARTTLGVIDEKWKDHLYDLDQLRAAIQYRAWGQKDPLVEYKQEAYDMFVGLMHDLRSTFTERWLKLQIEVAPPPPPPPASLAATARSSQRRAPALAPAPVAAPAGGQQARRPQPMVASKPAADGLIRDGEPDARRAAKPAVAEPAFARNPYVGVGRNEPCPCGSGKKFKKCHGAAA